MGVGLLLAAGVGALLIARGRSDEATPAGSAEEAEVGVDVRVGLRMGALDRSYVLHVPPGYEGDRSTPLVMVLHASGGDAADAAHISGMSAKSDAEGFLAVYPEGTGESLTWNAGLCCGFAGRRAVDDVGFLRAVIAAVAAEYTIDFQRVYVTGMSNGAMMAYRLGCEAGDVFAAIAPVAGALEVEDCAPAVPVSTIVFHGTADLYVPYAGGVAPVERRGMDRDYPAVPDTVSFWAGSVGCTGSTDEGMSAHVVRQVRTGCQPGLAVELYSIDGGGHAWPGGERAGPRGDIPSTEVSATDEIWEFFVAHPKP